MKSEENGAPSSAAGGFARAVLPTADSTLITASDNLYAGETTVPSQGLYALFKLRRMRGPQEQALIIR